MWDLPGPGLKPMSPALAGGFLTTAPPRKSRFSFVFDFINVGFLASVQLKVLVSLQSKGMSLKSIIHGIRNINRSTIQDSFLNRNVLIVQLPLSY